MNKDFEELYNNFINIHKNQLNEIPIYLWKKLFYKLK